MSKLLATYLRSICTYRIVMSHMYAMSLVFSIQHKIQESCNYIATLLTFSNHGLAIFSFSLAQPVDIIILFDASLLLLDIYIFHVLIKNLTIILDQKTCTTIVLTFKNTCIISCTEYCFLWITVLLIQEWYLPLFFLKKKMVGFLSISFTHKKKKKTRDEYIMLLFEFIRL